MKIAVAFNRYCASGKGMIATGQLRRVSFCSTLFLIASFLMADSISLSASVSRAKLTVAVSHRDSNAPVISRFNPESGPVGTVVTISGVNLSKTIDLSFGGISTSDFSVTSDQVIVARVPTGAVRGSISVSTSENRAESSQVFLVVYPPKISHFTPTNGPHGTTVTIYGDHFSGLTAVSFNGTPTTLFELLSDSEIRTNTSWDASSGLISVVNSAGVTASSDSFEVTRIPSELTSVPTHDSYVRSNRPTTNYGDSDELTARETPEGEQIIYLKFKVVGLGTSADSAKLYLHSVDRSRIGGSLFLVSNNYRETNTAWTENELTWSNQPLISGAPLAVARAAASDDIFEFDVTKVIIGDGEYSFALISKKTDAVKYSSREGEFPPRLVIKASTPAVADETPQEIEATVSITTVKNLNADRLPKSLLLRPNYPNPFNVATQFEYGLPEVGSVQVTVYNLLGQVVRVLVNEEQTAGYRRVLWDGTDRRGKLVGSGAFFVQLRVGEERLVRRITLQK